MEKDWGNAEGRWRESQDRARTSRFRVLGAGRVADASALFELDVEMFPSDGNTWRQDGIEASSRAAQQQLAMVAQAVVTRSAANHPLISR
ncbi:hypothetical protein F0U59_39310 [Archangium gephyra]|nr:hypothetical protein F0U59_39310 [Archangium gephyra]